jgi:hypothetical protein
MKTAFEALKTILSIAALAAVTGAFLSGATALTPKWPGFAAHDAATILRVGGETHRIRE